VYDEEDGVTSGAEAAFGGIVDPLPDVDVEPADDDDDVDPSVVLLRFEELSLPPLLALLSFFPKNMVLGCCAAEVEMHTETRK
jgi:hypothetical protein